MHLPTTSFHGRSLITGPPHKEFKPTHTQHTQETSNTERWGKDFNNSELEVGKGNKAEVSHSPVDWLQSATTSSRVCWSINPQLPKLFPVNKAGSETFPWNSDVWSAFVTKAATGAAGPVGPLTAGELNWNSGVKTPVEKAWGSSFFFEASVPKLKAAALSSKRGAIAAPPS